MTRLPLSRQAGVVVVFLSKFIRVEIRHGVRPFFPIRVNFLCFVKQELGQHTIEYLSKVLC